MRRALLTAVGKPDPLAGVNIGDSFMGGYFAGIIDTTVGNIIAADASQTGLRYALIVAPASLAHASRTYKSTADAAVAQARTRWDGLAATTAMVAAGGYAAANWCWTQTFPTDAASRWYLPAMDELELIFRNLKATTETNSTLTETFTFPPTGQKSGVNPSSDPTGSGYTSSAPAQTAVLAFRDGGGQNLGTAGSNAEHWTCTESETGGGWLQRQSSTLAGFQTSLSKDTSRQVRPVRRLPL